MEELKNALKDVYWDPIVDLWSDDDINVKEIPLVGGFMSLMWWIFITALFVVETLGSAIILAPRAIFNCIVGRLRKDPA